MMLIFQILAMFLAGIAAYFLWQGNTDGVFVAGVLGAVSYFISLRFQVKARIQQRETDSDGTEKSEI